MLAKLAATTAGHHRRTLWLACLFLIVAGVIGGPLAGSLKSSANNGPTASDSRQADRLLQRATGLQAASDVILVLRTPGGVRADARRIRRLTRRLATVPGLSDARGPAAVSAHGREVLLTASLTAGAVGQTVADAVESRFGGERDVTVGGSVVAGAQIGSTVTTDLARSEIIVLPLLIVLGLLFFRGRAAMLPYAVGATAVLGTFLALAGVNAFYGLSVYALNLVIGLGLGLSIDYTLLILNRYRDELERGARVEDAITTAMVQAGQSVVFSALTVSVALATLVVFPLNFSISMGIAGALTALVAALSALVLTPALLATWGTKLARPAAPRAARRWARLARAVTRRPGIIATVTAAGMVAVAASSLGTHWTPFDSQVIPRHESARMVADILDSRFPTVDGTPIVVVARAPANARTALAAFSSRVRRDPQVAQAQAPRYAGQETWTFDVRPRGDPTGSGAQAIVRAIRDLPAGFAVHVGGQAADFVDQQSAIAGRLPLAVGLLAGLTFVVLWLMTGSVILPLKALVMNALTVGAALAPLNLIYGHGRLTGLLGYTPNGGVEPIDFLVAAALIFALSTDYGVFLLGRICEAHRAGAGTRQAVIEGVARTGRVLTAAAILLAVAIGAFATSDISFIQQIGVACAFGVLVDAFVVRSLLVPSLMVLLGPVNWWSPRSLHRIHGGLAGWAANPPT